LTLVTDHVVLTNNLA